MEKRNYNFKALSVLVVDDSEHMRKLLKSLLGMIDIGHVALARDGAEGLDVYKEQLPDIVITDGAMEMMDGYEMTRLIRMDRNNPNPFVPVVMLSGYLEKERVEKARDCGITEYLAKPVSVQKLHERLISVIENPRQFVRTTTYFGPDRRRRIQDLHFGQNRRAGDTQQARAIPSTGNVDITTTLRKSDKVKGVDFIDPPNYLLAKVTESRRVVDLKVAKHAGSPKKRGGQTAFDPHEVNQVAAVIDKAQTSLSGLMQEEIAHIKSLFWLVENGNIGALKQLYRHLRELEALAVTPEYEPVGRISQSLCAYIASQPNPSAIDSRILSPHIDTLVCVFMRGKEAGSETENVVDALRALTATPAA